MHARRDPEDKVNRRDGGRAFQRQGPIVAKDLDWAIVILTRQSQSVCRKNGVVYPKLQIKGREYDS